MALMRASMPTRPGRRLEVALDQPFAFTAVLRESRLPIVAGWVATPTCCRETEQPVEQRGRLVDARAVAGEEQVEQQAA